MSSTPCVFVTGVWKSGNHLAYSAINALGIPGPFNGISAHLLFGRYAWAKRFLRKGKTRGPSIQVGLETDALVDRSYIEKQIKRLEGKILGGHAAYSVQLEDALIGAGARIVCIRRDPRDILVSFADWIESRPDFYLHQMFNGLSREDRVRRLLKGGNGNGFVLLPFSTVLSRAQGWMQSEAALQVSFERLIGEKGGGSADRQSEDLKAIHTHIAAPISFEKVPIDSIYGGSLTFNKGRSQRWRELQDAALIDQMQEELDPFLKLWGYAN